MENDSAWKETRSGDLMQCDFARPPDWTSERVAAAQEEFAALIEKSDWDARVPAPGWLQLARRLPSALRAALVAELRAGNVLTGIGSSGWPNDGSIVVNMRERFSAARRAPSAGVVWRELNDPHYAREELSQKVDSVEFLIIT